MLSGDQGTLWVVDFGSVMALADAKLFETPFELLDRIVRPIRELVRRATYRNHWWLFAEPCQKMRDAVSSLARFIATPTVAKYRVFVWLDSRILPDHQLIAIARDDDTTFGILHSRFHEAWSLRLGTWLGVGTIPATPQRRPSKPFPSGRPHPQHPRRRLRRRPASQESPSRRSGSTSFARLAQPARSRRHRPRRSFRPPRPEKRRENTPTASCRKPPQRRSS